jgi:hypothetical protein
MAEETEETETEDEVEDGAADLGDAGKQALDRERSARKSAERTARAAKAELDRLRAEGASEAEKVIAKAKADGAAEASTKANAKILRAEVRAAATGKLADPADAARFLDLSEFEVSDEGEVDAKALAKAIDALLKEKSYLGKGETRRTTGSADGGARGGNGSNGPDMNAWLRGEPGVRL